METPIAPLSVPWRRFRLAETDARIIFVDEMQPIVLSISPALPRGACVSFPALILVLPDRPRLHRQWRLVLLAVSVYSLDQRLVCQSFASNAVNEAIEPHQSVVLDVAFVHAERKFVNIAGKMLLARMMIDAVDATLHNSKNAFDPVGRDTIANVLAQTMLAIETYDDQMLLVTIVWLLLIAFIVCMRSL